MRCLDRLADHNFWVAEQTSALHFGRYGHRFNLSTLVDAEIDRHFEAIFLRAVVKRKVLVDRIILNQDELPEHGDE